MPYLYTFLICSNQYVVLKSTAVPSERDERLRVARNSRGGGWAEARRIFYQNCRLGLLASVALWHIQLKDFQRRPNQ
tara:strand:- start:446 stop:676 length:231 start_codon:yes stop_codon:yes gene_type:complete